MNYCRKRFIKIIFSIIILTVVLWSCDNKKESEILYKPTPTKTLDITCQWISNKKNALYPDYIPIALQHYNYYIQQKNYSEAAQVLDLICDNLDYNNLYKADFLKTLSYFSNNYRKRLSAKSTTFTDSYFGNYYSDIGNYKKAIVFFKKIAAIPPDDYDSCLNTARAYYDLSYCYFSMGKQSLALENNLKSLEYYTKIGDLEGIGNVYLSYSSIYNATNHSKEAYANVDKAINCYKKSNSPYNYYISMYNKIYIFEKNKNIHTYDLIESTYKQYHKDSFKNEGLTISFDTYYIEKLVHENRLAEAKTILEQLKPLVDKINSTTSTQEYLVARALYEIKKNKIRADVRIIINTIPILKENSDFEKIIDFEKILKSNALLKKDYKAALYYEEELQKAKDSSGNNDTKNKVIEIASRYQSEKQKEHIKLQEKTIFNKNTTIALLGSIIVVFFIITFLFISNLQQRKLNNEKKHTLRYTKKLLEKTEEERQRIASDLHDSLSHELLNLKVPIANDINATNQKIDQIIDDIRTISRNLHPVMFDKIGLTTSVEQLVERAQINNNFMVTAEIDYHHCLPSNSELQIYRIIQEALSNIIKYSDAVAAKISIIEKNKKLFIEIKDNGKGFNVREALKNKNSFGLHNIIERSKAIGGKAKIISSPNGTIITIEI